MPKTHTTQTPPAFDPTALMAPFTKMPNFDVDALVDAQRRNIEAVSTANQVAVEAVKTLTERQTELARNAVEEYMAAVRDMLSTKDINTGTAKQVEYAKSAFEKSFTNMKELTELAVKANTEAFNVLNKRFVESIEEMQSFARKS